MEDRKIRVAITHGDTNGIGYELIFKTFAEPEILELCTPIIYGSPKVAAYHRKALDIPANFSIISKAEEAKDGRVNMLTTFDEEVKVDLGTPTPEAGTAAVKALDKAMGDFRAGLFDVLVTAPVNNDSIQDFNSQTDYLENSIGQGQKTLTILLNDNIRVGFATNNLPIKEVAQSITKEMIIEKATIFFNCIKRDFNISNPRIAILSLNPTTNGNGKEEQEIIKPAINELSDVGVNAFGPFQADNIFGKCIYDSFDGVLAMYHDQGKAPFMALDPTDGVNYLAGLPIICTAPCDGPSFDIAGKGVADEMSFRHAIYLAIDIFRNRQNYDKPLANPLKKLYHERRDESEKVRFSIPKKHENSIQEKQE